MRFDKLNKGVEIGFFLKQLTLLINDAKKLVLQKNQSGAALIEVMLAMAISGAVSVAVLKITDTTTKAMKKIEDDAKFRDFVSGQLRPHLTNPYNCLATFSTVNTGTLPANLTQILAADKTDVENSASYSVVFDVDVNPNVAAFNLAAGETARTGSWTIARMDVTEFSPLDVGGQVGQCTFRVDFQKVERNKVVSYGTRSRTEDIQLFCTIDSTTSIINSCSAISTREEGIWQYRDRDDTGDDYLTFIEYSRPDGAATLEDRKEKVVIGAPPSEFKVSGAGSPVDLDVAFRPQAPLSIYTEDVVWQFPTFLAGVGIPKGSVYTWHQEGSTQRGNWGITEVGTSGLNEPTVSAEIAAGTACLNFLTYNNDNSNPAIYPHVTHCNLNTLPAGASANYDENYSTYRGSLIVSQGDIDVGWGSIMMGRYLPVGGPPSYASKFDDTNTEPVKTAFDIINNPTTSPSYNAALGHSNVIETNNSLTLGSRNKILLRDNAAIQPTDSAHIIGHSNQIEDAENDIIIGDGNKIEGINRTAASYIVGYENLINSTADAGIEGSDTFIIGSNNFVDEGRNQGFIFGSSNIDRHTDTSSSDATNLHNNSYIFGFMNSHEPSTAPVSNANNSFSIGKFIKNTHRNTLMFSSIGVSEGGTSRVSSTEAEEVVFHNRNGLRMFITSVEGTSQLREVFRIEPNGGLSHGPDLNYLDVTSNMVGDNTTSEQNSVVLAALGSTNAGRNSAIIGGQSHVLESDSTPPAPTNYSSVASNIILGGNTNTIKARGINGIYNGVENVINVQTGDNDLSQANAIIGGLRNQLVDVRDGNLIINSEDSQMNSYAPPGQESKHISNSIILNSRGSFIERTPNDTDEVTANVIIGSEDARVTGYHQPMSASNVNGPSSNIIVSAKNAYIEGGYNNYLAGHKEHPVHAAHLGNSVIVAGSDLVINPSRNSKVSFANSFIQNHNGHFEQGVYNFNFFRGASIYFAGGPSSNKYIGNVILKDYEFGNPLYINQETSHTFIASYIGGIYLYTNNLLSSGVRLAAGSNSWASLSSKTYKTKYQDINSDEFTEKFMNLPIKRWRYLDQKGLYNGHQITSIGTFSEDFEEVFKTGPEDFESVATFEVSGVAFKMAEILAKRDREIKSKNISNRFGRVYKKLKALFSELVDVMNDAKENHKDIKQLKREIAQQRE